MRFLQRWFGTRPVSAEAVSARDAWQHWSPPASDLPLERVRWVVVDTETSGLDPRRDRLLSIGAVAAEAGEIRLAESVEVFLRQTEPSAVSNVLVHGIGHGLQSAGKSPEQCLSAFLALARRDVLVGFHTLFDVLLLQGALEAHLGIRYQPIHLDLGLLLPVLFRAMDESPWDLDRWAARFRLETPGRHGALSDALTTAELLLIALRQAGRSGHERLADLVRIQEERLAGMQKSSAPAGGL